MTAPLWPATLECLGVTLNATYSVEDPQFQTYVYAIEGITLIRIIAHTKVMWEGYARVFGVEITTTGPDGLALGSAEEVVKALEARVRIHLWWAKHLQLWNKGEGFSIGEQST